MSKRFDLKWLHLSQPNCTVNTNALYKGDKILFGIALFTPRVFFFCILAIFMCTSCFCVGEPPQKRAKLDSVVSTSSSSLQGNVNISVCKVDIILCECCAKNSIKQLNCDSVRYQ